MLVAAIFSRRPAILKPLRESHSVVGKYHKSWEFFFGAAVDFTARQLNQIESNFVDFMKLFRFQSSRLEHVKLNWAVNVFHFYLHAECRKSDFKSLLITLIFNTLIISHHRARKILKNLLSKCWWCKVIFHLLRCLLGWWFADYFMTPISVYGCSWTARVDKTSAELMLWRFVEVIFTVGILVDKRWCEEA